MRYLLLALALTACQHVKKDGSVCPEYRDLRCMAGTRCSMDKDRGCKVCRCEDVEGDEPIESPDDQSRPPDSSPY